MFIFPPEQLCSGITGKSDFADFVIVTSTFLTNPIDGGANCPSFTRTLDWVREYCYCIFPWFPHLLFQTSICCLRQLLPVFQRPTATSICRKWRRPHVQQLQNLDQCRILWPNFKKARLFFIYKKNFLVLNYKFIETMVIKLTPGFLVPVLRFEGKS